MASTQALLPSQVNSSVCPLRKINNELWNKNLCYSIASTGYQMQLSSSLQHFHRHDHYESATSVNFCHHMFAFISMKFQLMLLSQAINARRQTIKYLTNVMGSHNAIVKHAINKYLSAMTGVEPVEIQSELNLPSLCLHKRFNVSFVMFKCSIRTYYGWIEAEATATNLKDWNTLVYSVEHHYQDKYKGID